MFEKVELDRRVKGLNHFRMAYIQNIRCFTVTEIDVLVNYNILFYNKSKCVEIKMFCKLMFFQFLSKFTNFVTKKESYKWIWKIKYIYVIL